jgi:homoserine kinase type II
MDVPDLFKVLADWPIEQPETLTPLAGGTNNQAWFVQTHGGASYVLRLTSGEIDLPRFYYETALLEALREKSLSFQLPHPLQARSGDILVLVEQNRATPAMATLTPFLPGTIPERNATNIARAGVALAQLDAALATIQPDLLPTSTREASFVYGDLSHCHPLVPDPLVTLEKLVDPEQVRPILDLLKQSERDWEMLSAQELPQQLLHRDCGPGNMLIEQEQISAILDFEFAGRDRRLFDLCVAISWWPVRSMGTGHEWELIDAFGRAYMAHYPLTREELLALPAAFRLRDTTALVYRAGRYLAGLETHKTLQERVRHSLWRETWLRSNCETLLQHALAWSTLSVGDV